MSKETMNDEEVDYESDPEETKLSLKMRRRVASDDEEEDGENRGERPLRRMDDSDVESEGAPAEYEDELEDEDYDYVDEEIEPEYKDGGNERGEERVVPATFERAEEVGDDMLEKGMKNEVSVINDENNVDGGEHEGEKKGVEPFAVPTAGAFYMHDDRFRDNASGKQGRMLGGRKLWESRDERKWGHDKFEELTLQERRYDERKRGSRGRYRGRGRNRGMDSNNLQGYQQKEHINSRSDANSNLNNASLKGAIARGRGPRRYHPSWKKNNEAPQMEKKEFGKIVEKPSFVGSERFGESASNSISDSGVVPLRKQGFASNLSIASPPFYPSGSSAKENNAPHKKEMHPGSVNHSPQQSVVDKSFTGSQSSTILRGKSTFDSIDFDNLSLDDSFSEIAGKPSTNKPTQAPSRVNGRGMISTTQMAYRPIISNSQVNRSAPPGQLQTIPRNPCQTRVQSSGEQFMQISSGSQDTSGVEITHEPEEFESPLESSKSKSTLVAKGKNNVQGSGRGLFQYGGAPVMGASGNMGSSHGDQNFPTFLPFMQFRGKHPGGMGVPAVGMAFPGYVGQPQPGLGNSEMTWLPVLAGAAGALGASYCPPYISVDGSYHTRPSGHMSNISSALSNENNLTRVNSDLKPENRTELANEDSGQRQKNPRRYTEMKFDQ